MLLLLLPGRCCCSSRSLVVPLQCTAQASVACIGLLWWEFNVFGIRSYLEEMCQAQNVSNKNDCLTAFGGPAAHIAMMEDEVVEKRKWMSTNQSQEERLVVAFKEQDVRSGNRTAFRQSQDETSMHVIDGQRDVGKVQASLLFMSVMGLLNWFVVFYFFPERNQDSTCRAKSCLRWKILL